MDILHCAQTFCLDLGVILSTKKKKQLIFGSHNGSLRMFFYSCGKEYCTKEIKKNIHNSFWKTD